MFLSSVVLVDCVGIWWLCVVAFYPSPESSGMKNTDVLHDCHLTNTAEYSPFLGIEKGAVLQEARAFNEPQIDPRRCSQVCVTAPKFVGFQRISDCSFFG